MRKKIFQLILVSVLLWVPSQAFSQDNWLSIKGKHFVVYYRLKQDTTNARTVLRKAESYYDKIADQIGYTRYATFWTWDARVKIIIFPNQKTFVANTRQPLWSRGYASHHSDLFRSRVIVTFRQEQGFLDGLLPHEISHLILKDFIGFDQKIPIWFDEGVAQLNDGNRIEVAQRVIAPLARKRSHIPFKIFFHLDIRKEKDSKIVDIFYAQSVSVVNFLIRKYGRSAFQRLCQSLRDGRQMTEAIRTAYAPSIESIEILEDKWVQSFGS